MTEQDVEEIRRDMPCDPLKLAVAADWLEDHNADPVRVHMTRLIGEFWRTAKDCAFAPYFDGKEDLWWWANTGVDDAIFQRNDLPDSCRLPDELFRLLPIDDAGSNVLNSDLACWETCSRAYEALMFAWFGRQVNNNCVVLRECAKPGATEEGDPFLVNNQLCRVGQRFVGGYLCGVDEDRNLAYAAIYGAVGDFVRIRRNRPRRGKPWSGTATYRLSELQLREEA